MASLKEIRQRFDALDRQLVELLEQRFELASAIGEQKQLAGMAVVDAAREAEVLTNVTAQASATYRHNVAAVYQILLEESKRVQVARLK